MLYYQSTSMLTYYLAPPLFISKTKSSANYVKIKKNADKEYKKSRAKGLT